MYLANLPCEILLVIAEFVEHERDLNALVQTSFRCYSGLNIFLYRHSVRNTCGAGLVSAAGKGSLGAVQKFLDLGVDVNWKRAPRGQTAIQNAALGGHIEVVRHLLNIKGIKLRYANDLGSVLDYAIRGGSIPMVKLLLADSRIKPNIKSTKRSAPIHHAADTGNPDVVKLLLADKRVDPNLRGGIRRTALHIAVRKGHHAVQKLLVKYSDVDLNAKAGPLARTPLLEALKAPIETSPADSLRILLSSGRVDIEMCDNRLNSALSLAAKAKSPEYIEILLEWGANIESRDHYEFTPLLTAARAPGDLCDNVEFLLNSGADFRAVEMEGRNALALAAQYNNSKTVELLLRHGGIDPNISDNVGFTPLLLATHEDNFGIMSTLVSCDRVDVNRKDNFGNTAMHQASYNSSPRSAKILLEREEADINVKNNEGLSPLALAVARESNSLVSIYTRYGADINSKDNTGTTPVMVAIKNKNVPMVKELLSMGTLDFDPKNDQGMALLNCASQSLIELIREKPDGNPLAACYMQEIILGTSLSRAALLGKAAVVDILLTQDGIQLNPRTRDGGTQLSTRSTTWSG
ncbi:hypothetical protein TESG_02130 [Trichophyton tonsurans CBS 112818]|uniref:Uncharacterized protein n=1 Tax=Trichophyton tonsurans (strain CBS 112818) TaxID=647933 RepID=F2RTH2_TRIT1|nr:hypothetical protein TESG_02130 [Trichophyton tonsurans CBS 112818]